MKQIVYGLVLLTGLIVAIISVATRGDAQKVVPAFLLGLVMGVVYYVPSLIATSRKRKNEVAIVVLNAVAGWSFLGWVGALVWALLKTDEKI